MWEAARRQLSESQEETSAYVNSSLRTDTVNFPYAGDLAITFVFKAARADQYNVPRLVVELEAV